MKRLTNEEFVNRMSLINPDIEILGEYVNASTKVCCRCKICGHIWDGFPCNLLRGTGCKKCSDKRLAETKLNDQESFINRLNDINPNIEILSQYQGIHKKVKCRCRIDGYEWEATPANLLKGKGCPKCSKRIKRTHEQFVEEMKCINSNIIVLSRYENNSKKVKCKCLIDGHIWEAIPTNLLKGSGCPLCSNKVVVRGINDIATTDPWMIPYLNDKEDAYKYTSQSNKSINFRCLDCGEVCKSIICNIYKRGFTCKICSDKISYPNKFGRAFLNQLPIDGFIPEYSPAWANNKRYDNYFEYNNKKYILEMDGEWHFKDNNLSGKSIEDAQFEDKLKDNMAKNNNITVIRIDCKKSEKEYISNNIKNSILQSIFNLSEIDWEICDEMASKNLIKYISDIFNETNDVGYICELLNMKKNNVQYYLKKGTTLGFCDYNGYLLTKNKKGGHK